MAGRVLAEALDISDGTFRLNTSPDTAVRRWAETSPAGLLRWSQYAGRRYLDEARR
jgi:hypothetical protein